MSIIYMISSLLIFALLLLIKKSENKLEIVKTIIITIITKIAYNAFICYILNLINVPITLFSLSIINFIIATILVLFIIKNKEIQKYEISKSTLVVSMLFIIITTIILCLNFDNLTKIHYVSMDAREHYKAAREFSENTQLSNKAIENNTVAKTFMPVEYTNIGIAFKILKPYVGTVQLYKAYILFEALVYLLTSLCFYFVIEGHITNKRKNTSIIIALFSIVYMLGYPLNGWICGFHYLVLGILFIEAITYMLTCSNKIKYAYKIILLFLINFGLILSYALFCPFVYLAEFICFIYKGVKEKNKTQTILNIIAALIIPGIIGLSYLILPVAQDVSHYIAKDGWLYKNLWSNFILFIPFSVYEIYKSIKKKEFNFEIILFFILIIYMLVLFIGTNLNKVSEYYFYKTYYILWFLLICLNIKGMLDYEKISKDNAVTNIYTSFYIIIFIIMTIINNTYVIDKSYDNFGQIMQIFSFNKTMILEHGEIKLDSGELKLLNVLEKSENINWKKQDEILIVTDATKGGWVNSVTGHIDDWSENKEYVIENLPNYKYFVLMKEEKGYEILEKYVDNKNINILCENDAGKIYVRKEK